MNIVVEETLRRFHRAALNHSKNLIAHYAISGVLQKGCDQHEGRANLLKFLAPIDAAWKGQNIYKADETAGFRSAKLQFLDDLFNSIPAEWDIEHRMLLAFCIVCYRGILD